MLNFVDAEEYLYNELLSYAINYGKHGDIVISDGFVSACLSEMMRLNLINRELFSEYLYQMFYCYANDNYMKCRDNTKNVFDGLIDDIKCDLGVLLEKVVFDLNSNEVEIQGQHNDL